MLARNLVARFFAVALFSTLSSTNAMTVSKASTNHSNNDSRRNDRPPAVIVSTLNGEKKGEQLVEATLTDDAQNSFQETTRSTHLVVHFDINETILVGDEAGGDTREDCLNKILAKSAFVEITGDDDDDDAENDNYSKIKPTHWWDGSPILEHYKESSPPPPLYTGWNWPKGCCPYYRTAYKKRSKTFVSHHGSIYRATYEKMQNILKPHFKGHAILSHMIPAIFETLTVLTSKPESTTIVLRTFGTDLPEIAKAITEFARGEHRDYQDYRNQKLEMSSDCLVQGRWAKVHDDRNNEYVYQLWKDDQLVASGDAAVLDFIHSLSICGIQDDYHHWNSNHCEPWAGKPVWIPRNQHYHHVLLDDNIHNLEHDSIASVRVEEETNDNDDNDSFFRTMTGSEILDQQGVHLIRVPTVEPVLNSHWFLNKINRARQLYAAKYHKMDER